MSRRLKLLFHTRSTGGGGAERVTAVLARELAARGHSVTLAVDHLDEAAVDLPGVDVLRLPPGRAAPLLALTRLIAGGRFDGIVAALSLAVVRSAAAKALALSRSPLVISYHGFEENKLGGAGPLAYGGMPVLKRVAARIVCVSEALSAFMIARWGAPPDRTVTLYNPVDLPAAAAARSPAATRAPLVVAIGRLSPEKGMADLLEAFARVRFPEARLVVAGDGPEATALRARAAEPDLAGRVSFPGWLADTTSLLAEARVVAVPSRSEAFSLVTVEALASGAAVVATDCGGPREILAGGRHGELVAIGDPAALAAALERALSDPGDGSTRLARAQDFSVAAGVDRWEALLLDLAP